MLATRTLLASPRSYTMPAVGTATAMTALAASHTFVDLVSGSIGALLPTLKERFELNSMQTSALVATIAASTPTCAAATSSVPTGIVATATASSDQLPANQSTQIISESAAAFTSRFLLYFGKAPLPTWRFENSMLPPYSRIAADAARRPQPLALARALAKSGGRFSKKAAKAS